MNIVLTIRTFTKCLLVFTAALLLTNIAKAQLPSDDLYQRFILEQNTSKPDSAYGRIPEHPIRLGANKYITDPNQERSLMTRFVRTYTWPDGSPIYYPKPTTVFLSGINVEKFVLKKPGATDSLTIYVDMFNEGLVNVPDGLALYSKQQLAKDLVPLLDTIKTLFTAKDPYKNPAIQQKTFIYINELQSVAGLDFLMDNDLLTPLINISDADADLKAYLVRSYIFHKFVNEATGQAGAKNKAYNAMVDEYHSVLTLHPDLKKGHLDEIMKKRS